MNRMFVGSVCLLLLFLSSTSFAHTYYEGITDITINTVKKRAEIIHRYTTHDFEVLLSEMFSQRITADQTSYESYLKQYIQKQFTLKQNNKSVALEWVGVESGMNETTIYQTAEKLDSLAGVIVKNSILIGFYSQQINRTNYDDGHFSGTLIFNGENHSHVINLEK